MGEGEHDRVAVVGAGPNGLAAAITLAEAGLPVTLYEAGATVGGGMRTAELTLPGFRHDICSAIVPLALASPFFRRLPLERLGTRFIQPPLPLAHPFDDGSAAVLARSIEETAASLGPDAAAYAALMRPLLAEADKLLVDILSPLRLPHHPLLLARFGRLAIRSAAGLARARFRGERARALFAGMAAHAMLPLERPPSAAFGLVLGLLGHAVGWPLVEGGTQRLAEALARHLTALGGEIVTGRRIESLDELAAKTILFDLSPRQLEALAGERFPAAYRRQLRRYRYGPGVFKLDWALAGPIPWRAPACRRAGTVHLGATLPEIARAEAAVHHGRISERPFVLLAQPSLFDPTRAPAGRQTAWAYCHVPNGSPVDMTERIEAQVERFAPGFRDLILARHTMSAVEMETYDANYVGGDINGGLADLRQTFFRPAVRIDPYSTPDPRLTICSASTPPGGGVHGMCGYLAAVSALQRLGR
ncbi:MAG TPA: NAD(P)/FAD-dependent oxidoreductase [Thermomicrobiaceae bacterium]|nr:NAD(P)/FAD-dependent oxidoreductase [Thermomicrobiaceae bacterium]